MARMRITRLISEQHCTHHDDALADIYAANGDDFVILQKMDIDRTHRTSIARPQ